MEAINLRVHLAVTYSWDSIRHMHAVGLASEIKTAEVSVRIPS